MSVSDILDHLCAPEAAFSEIALCSVAFLSPLAPLLRIHWPLATVLSLPPHQRGQVVRRLFPAGYCHPPTPGLPKTERDPISTSGPSLSVCHRNSACYRTRQFLRTNPSVSPRSPPPDR